jgi:transglutaminase-like putative cysteine protease
MHRTVSCELGIDLVAPTDVVLSVAVAGAAAPETFSATLDGAEVAVRCVLDDHGGRLHALDQAGPGSMSVTYLATIAGRAEPAEVTDRDRLRYLRPSRYCESDRLGPIARAEFSGLQGIDLLNGVSSWVGQHLRYVPGSSRPTDGAVNTLLAREGVCRDFAHLTIALLRACDVPARLVSVYAPGLQPMDFHAVAEAVVDDRWLILDATCLAPRSALVRIATGRDASDTAFLTLSGGTGVLQRLSVTAVCDDELPGDDLDHATQLG